MKLLFLSKENIPLAKAEAEALLGKGRLDENLLLIGTIRKTDRLAYTKVIGQVLFAANAKNIDKKIENYSWRKLIKGSFAVTVLANSKRSQGLERRYGGIVYDTLKNPKVDLENPTTNLIIIKTKKKYYVCIPEWENKEDFEARKSHKRPVNLPIGLHPKLARACVNLTGSTTSIYDPFCGLGSFLIEGGLIGLQVIGSDIDERLIQLCSKNLTYYNIRNNRLFLQDALHINKKYDYVVTDLPYGKNTKKISKELYPSFIRVLEKILKKRAVVIFPSFYNADQLLKKSKLKMKGRFKVYIHKSLSRIVYVLEK